MASVKGFIVEGLYMGSSCVFHLSFSPRDIRRFGGQSSFYPLATKIILMPLALWTPENSLLWCVLCPETFRLKTRYFGDETIEALNELNKKGRLSPLLSLIPLAVGSHSVWPWWARHPWHRGFRHRVLGMTDYRR